MERFGFGHPLVASYIRGGLWTFFIVAVELNAYASLTHTVLSIWLPVTVFAAVYGAFFNAVLTDSKLGRVGASATKPLRLVCTAVPSLLVVCLVYAVAAKDYYLSPGTNLFALMAYLITGAAGRHILTPLVCSWLAKLYGDHAASEPSSNHPDHIRPRGAS